ncbi:uncharacterized protein LOC114020123 [Chelonia mydas]|uniref:uncharacterized protein LOC114020123 n=1 Tax=Chelonia mydas TaxID=8469 RepID=UPI001CA8E402|nr:uncharacterized protein LOC114020123 [Chelonia mydas]
MLIKEPFPFLFGTQAPRQSWKVTVDRSTEASQTNSPVSYLCTAEWSLPTSEVQLLPLGFIFPDHHPVAVPAAAGTVCVLLVVLALVSTYFFVRKKRGRSPSTARSQTPFPDTTRTQSQPSDDKDPDVLYADLQHPARLQQPKQSAPEEHSEYAAIKVTPAIAT